MIKIEHVAVMNLEGALRGMRNPMDSWSKSDSFAADTKDNFQNDYIIGENDLKLCQNLIHGGPVHSKFLRQIILSMDIEAPLYFWKEFDTYKVSTAANSCSTMHTIHKKPISFDMFSIEHLNLDGLALLEQTLELMNYYRRRFLETQDKNDWWQIIQLLPTSFNQKRTVTLNYEVARNIYKWRKNHKLDEWQDFCYLLSMLPYGKELILFEN